MLDRYEIRGKIGEGGVGAVYRARDTWLNRSVAIKRLLPEEIARSEESGRAPADLVKEASLQSTLQHPNIVTVYDVGTDDDGAYVVMELLEGPTLTDAIEDGAPLTYEDFISVADQSLEALITAQAVGLLHRDIKPGNIMLTWLPSGSFRVKVLDFGLAKIAVEPSLQTLAYGDKVLGSVRYMAPEQFLREPLDGRTDLYALGCVLYFTLVGRSPCDAETPAEIMNRHLAHDIVPIGDLRDDIPAPVCDWLMGLMSLDPEDRPADAKAARRAFNEALRESKSTRLPLQGPPKPPQPQPEPAAPPPPPATGSAPVPVLRARPDSASAPVVARRTGPARVLVVPPPAASGTVPVAAPGFGPQERAPAAGTPPRANAPAVETRAETSWIAPVPGKWTRGASGTDLAPWKWFVVLMGALLLGAGVVWVAMLSDGDANTAIDWQPLVTKTGVKLEVAASGYRGDEGPAHTLDGDGRTRWTPAGPPDPWIRYRLETGREIDRLVIGFGPNGKLKFPFEIATSNDGKSWNTQFEGTSSPGGNGRERHVFKFKKTQTRHLRIVLKGNKADGEACLCAVGIPGVNIRDPASPPR